MSLQEILALDNIASVLIALVPALLNTGIVAYIIFKLPQNSTTRLFLYFVLFLIFWQFSDITMRISATEQQARFWDKFLCVTWLGVAPVALSMAAEYTQHRWLRSRMGRTLTFFPFILFHAIYISNQEPVQFEHDAFWGWINQPREGTLDGIQRFAVSLAVIFAVALFFWHAYKNRRHPELRNQSLLIAIGMAIPTVQGITTQVLFPVLKLSNEIPITSSFLTTFSIASIVAFSRYHLFSISDSVSVNSVLTNLSDIVVIIDKNKKTIFVNPYTKSRLKIADGDIPHWRIEGLFPIDSKDYEAFCEQVIDATLQGNVVRNYETVLHLPNKEKMDVIISSELVRSNGIVQGVMVVARDISDRKRLFQMLQSENKVFSMLASGVAANEVIELYLSETEKHYQESFISCVFYADSNNSTLLLGPAPAVKGKFRDLLTGLKIAVDGTPSGIAMFTKKTVVVNDILSLDVPQESKDAAVLHGARSISAEPILSSQGEMLGVLSLYGRAAAEALLLEDLPKRMVNIVRTILEQEQYLNTLNTQRKTYMDLVNTIDGIVYEFDFVSHRFDFVSQRSEDLLGFKQQEWYDESNFIFKHIHPEDLHIAQQKLMHLNAKNLEMEYRVFNAQHEVVWLRDYMHVFYENGKPVKLKGILIDITKTKLVELDREKITDDLIKRNKELEQFTYIVSHNLRAPVANIMGSSRILHIVEDEQDRIELLKGISTSANHLERVIMDLNTVLNMKKVSQDAKSVINLQALVHEVMEASEVDNTNGFEVDCDFSGLAEINSVKAYMHSIFYNLISNSYKYRSKDRAGRLNITAIADNGKACLSFKDNGLGIDMQANGKNVFGMYKRFHREIEGRGLGLFMVKSQIEALGGSIELQSEVDRGSEFKVYLPLQ